MKKYKYLLLLIPISALVSIFLYASFGIEWWAPTGDNFDRQTALGMMHILAVLVAIPIFLTGDSK